jgi:hypothetical protein
MPPGLYLHAACGTPSFRVNPYKNPSSAGTTSLTKEEAECLHLELGGGNIDIHILPTVRGNMYIEAASNSQGGIVGPCHRDKQRLALQYLLDT